MGIVLVLLMGAVGSAQPLVKANIPFEFQVGNQTLPAGEYEIGPAQNRDSFLLWVKKLDGTAITNIISFGRYSSGKHHKACLVFNQHADKYFLSQVWIGTEAFGRQLCTSKAEKELTHAAKTQASMTNASLKLITIAAK
jgi:hypothetical protein